MESLASTLVDSQVDLNPHQVEAALFACSNPLSRGVILADEVGLGKTIKAGLVISQRWAERRRRILIIVPANLRKQWHQELQDKFSLQGLILEAKNYNVIRKQEHKNPFLMESGPVICSYQFAKSKADDIKDIKFCAFRTKQIMDEYIESNKEYYRGPITSDMEDFGRHAKFFADVEFPEGIDTKVLQSFLKWIVVKFRSMEDGEGETSQ